MLLGQGTLDKAGNLYIVDNDRIRMVNKATGIISTVAGGGRQSGNGIPATSLILLPDTVAVDSAGNLYISDNGTNIRKVTKDGIINIVAGGAIGFSFWVRLSENAVLQAAVQRSAI